MPSECPLQSSIPFSFLSTWVNIVFKSQCKNILKLFNMRNLYFYFIYFERFSWGVYIHGSWLFLSCCSCKCMAHIVIPFVIDTICSDNCVKCETLKLIRATWKMKEWKIVYLTWFTANHFSFAVCTLNLILKVWCHICRTIISCAADLFCN